MLSSANAHRDLEVRVSGALGRRPARTRAPRRSSDCPSRTPRQASRRTTAPPPPPPEQGDGAVAVWPGLRVRLRKHRHALRQPRLVGQQLPQDRDRLVERRGLHVQPGHRQAHAGRRRRGSTPSATARGGRGPVAGSSPGRRPGARRSGHARRSSRRWTPARGWPRRARVDRQRGVCRLDRLADPALARVEAGEFGRDDPLTSGPASWPAAGRAIAPVDIAAIRELAAEHELGVRRGDGIGGRARAGHLPPGRCPAAETARRSARR